MKYLIYLGIIVFFAVIAFLAYYFSEHRNAWENVKTVFWWILSLAFYTFVAYLISGYILSKFTINVRILLSIFILLCVVTLFSIILFLSNYQKNNEDVRQKYDSCKKRIEVLEQHLHDKTIESAKWKIASEKYLNSLCKLQSELESVNEILNNLKTNTTAFPYMAGIVADYETIGLERMAQSLDWGSDKQRLKKVTDIRTLRKQSKELIEKYKVAAYQLAYLRELYPSLDDILDTEFSELKPSQTNFENVNADYDTVHEYLSKEEYWQLSETERNQLALDRYVSSHRKTKWQIGRDYEMYVGYKYSLKGYKVSYHGIEKGLEDLGRDLILEKDGHVLVVQCKYWSSEKTIREKHILQLYGTYICYCLENNISQKNARCIFVTNIKLSEQAKEFAKYLDVGIAEEFPLGEYPRIKCNVGKDEHGQKVKIYHLPFDQQYDNTQIKDGDEFFAFTVEEAENKGFRRAFKYHFA